MAAEWEAQSLSAVQGSKEWHALDGIWMEHERGEWAIKGIRDDEKGMTSRGLLVATNARLIFVVRGWFARRYEDLPYEKITAIHVKTGWGSGTLKIVASGGNLVVRRVPNSTLIAASIWLRKRTLGYGLQVPFEVPDAERAGIK